MDENSYQLELKNVTKVFQNGVVAVDNLDLKVRKGEFLTILGPSGCGKTTTLRMIAGFETPTEGLIYCEDIHLDLVPANKRPVNTVFQDYGLFPHMNVYDNIAYGLRSKKAPKESIQEEVIKALEMVSLSGFDTRYPRQLSGGQQQRVAVARAIVNKPRVLLLDEPLGALDLKLRKHMQIVLKELQQELGITFIHVTHDQEEAMTMSDRIAVFNDGKLQQIDTPEKLYLRPVRSFVANFIGENNLITVTVKEIGAETVSVEMDDQSILVNKRNMQDGITGGAAATLSIRPESILVGNFPSDIGNIIKGKIEQDIFAGSEVRLIIGCGDNRITANLSDKEQFHLYERGQDVKLGFKSEDAMLFMPSKMEEE